MPIIVDMKILKGQRREAICERTKETNRPFDNRIGSYLVKNHGVYNSSTLDISIEDQILCALNNGWSLKGEIIPPVGDDVFFFQLVVRYSEPDSSNLVS